MNQKQPQYEPVEHEVFQDMTNHVFIGKYIAFFVDGTWSVNIGRRTYLPGDYVHRELQGEVGDISYTPHIKFLNDMTDDPAVKANLRLKPGKRILVEFLQLK
jgi:hypothetical protein